MSDITRIIRGFQNATRAGQLDAVSLLSDYWLGHAHQLDADIIRLSQEMQSMEVSAPVRLQQVREMESLQQLRTQVYLNYAQYGSMAEHEIDQLAFLQMHLGQQQAEILMNYSFGGVMPQFYNRLPEDALRNLYAGLREDTPLHELLSPLGADTWDHVQNTLFGGLVRGKPMKKIAEEMSQAMNLGFARSLTIARTEILRARREASTETYRESGVVRGFKRLANKATACVACFVDYKVPILTSKGFKRILDVEVGDLVLTHKGRYKPVTRLIRQSVKEAQITTLRISVTGGKHLDSLTMTDEHPVLTKRGWIKAEDLLTSDLVAVPTKPCVVCGKPVLFRYRGNDVCSKECVGVLGADGLHSNEVSHNLAIENIKKTHAKMFENGTHPFQDPEIKKKAIRRALQANSRLTSSRTEGKLGEAFASIGLVYETQYPIPSKFQEKQNRQYYYYADFAFPEQKVVVEADGEPWHSWDEQRIEHDKRRQKRIEEQGWQVLRYTGSEIESDAGVIANEVKSILMNYDGEYSIEYVPIKSIVRSVRKPPSEKFRIVRYNLEVADDNSYVAKNMIVHNCLMLDGQYYDVMEDLADHPNGACTPIPIVKGGVDPQWETGREFFEGLSEEEQRERMGSKYFDAWKAGEFKLEDLVKMHHSDIWGDSPGVRPLWELKGFSSYREQLRSLAEEDIET